MKPTEELTIEHNAVLLASKLLEQVETALTAGSSDAPAHLEQVIDFFEGFVDCYTILGFGSYYAPDLTRTYYRINEDAIIRRLQQPEVTFADDFRKMPQQHLSNQEISYIVAYLQWVPSNKSIRAEFALSVRGADKRCGFRLVEACPAVRSRG